MRAPVSTGTPRLSATPRLTATMAGHCGTQGAINRLRALADRYQGMSRTLEPLRNAAPRANLSTARARFPRSWQSPLPRPRPLPTASGLRVASGLSDRVDLVPALFFRVQEFVPLLLAEMRHVHGGGRIVHDQPQDASRRHCAQTFRGPQNGQRTQKPQGIKLYVKFHWNQRYAACFNLSTEL